MTAGAGYAVSGALGAVMALAMVAASAGAASTLAGKRTIRSMNAAFAWGALLRMLGALAGVAIGVSLGPPSVLAFVMVFLSAYLAGHAGLRYRFGR